MPYFAEPDDKGWGKEHDYLINAAHARGLPGVICPLEGAWATTGINYPTVDVALIDSRVGELPVHPYSDRTLQRSCGEGRTDYRSRAATATRSEFWPVAGNCARPTRGFCLGELMDDARSEVHV